MSEALVGLASVDERDMQDAVVHVQERNELTLSWLRLVGVPEARVVDGSLARVGQLILPQLGDCGSPTTSQVFWLRQRVLEAFEENGSAYAGRPSSALEQGGVC